MPPRTNEFPPLLQSGGNIPHMLQTMRAVDGVIRRVLPDIGDILRIAILQIKALRMRDDGVGPAANVDESPLQILAAKFGTPYAPSL